MDWCSDILLVVIHIMNQQTLTSEKESDSCFLESSASRSFSFVFSVPNETVNSPASDVRFVFSNARPVDIRFFLDENGEIHSSLRIITKSRKKENREISKQEKESKEILIEKPEYREIQVAQEIENKETESIESEIQRVPRRRRPKGSKNKKSKQVLDKKKFQQEWFETNAEFKARVAEEMRHSQAA